MEVRKERHQKLFEGHYHSIPGAIWFYTQRGAKKVFNFFMPSRKRLSEFMHPLDKLPAPRRLYTQMVIFGLLFTFLNSVNISNAAFDGGEGVGNEYLSLQTEQNYLSDQEGYTIKTMPLEGETVADLNRTEKVEYTVKEGDTLSVIAYRYGLSTNSIKYANPTLGSGDYLKLGQALSIPPKDGIFVTVKSGSTLVSLMDKYKGSLDKTKEFNGIESDSDLSADQEIFIVDGRPEAVYIASTPKGTGGGGGSYSATPPSTQYYDIPASTEGWIRPTQGIITQGYHAGHYAYDIADRSKPPILAVASGIITFASAGTYGGGYGTNVWIDHGNGYTTHYAHMEEMYVNEGDMVEQGQVIGKMGNSGRVYGATGIHLHFEIAYNGVKISPSGMGVW